MCFLPKTIIFFKCHLRFLLESLPPVLLLLLAVGVLLLVVVVVVVLAELVAVQLVVTVVVAVETQVEDRSFEEDNSNFCNT